MAEKNPSVRRTVIKNAFYQGITGIITRVGSLVFTIILARVLFPELFGVYSLVLTIVLTLLTITELGIGTTVVRYISDSLSKKNNQKEARSRWLFLLKFRFFIATIVAVLLFLSADLISSFFNNPILALPIRIGSIYLFVNLIYGLAYPLFLAVQKLKFATISEIIFQSSRIILIFVFFLFYKTVESAFWVLAISSLLGIFVVSILLLKKYPFLIKGKTQPVEAKRMIKFSSFIAFSLIGIMILANIDKLFLGYFIDIKFLGFYTAMLTIVSGVIGILGFTGIFLPVFTQLTGAKLKQAFRKTFHYISIIVFPITIGLAFVIMPFLRILYGEAYVPEQYLFTLTLTSVFLSFIVLESIFSGLYKMLFHAKEKPKIPALTTTLAAVLNIILNIVFIYFLIQISPELGLVGAASATVISSYINLGVLTKLSKKKFKITINKTSVFKPLFASLVMLLFLFLFDHFFALSIPLGILMIILAAAVYFITMLLIRGIGKEDIREFSLKSKDNHV